MSNGTAPPPALDPSPWPWAARFHSWKIFQLDALGLVTLLGHEEVNEGLGRLVPSRYVEYFPMLGAFVVAGDRFKERKPSFNLYNITQGIHTTDLSCWMTRWLLAQDFEKTCSIVQFEVAETPRSFWKWRIIAALLSLGFTGFLLAMTILANDRYGQVNAAAMIISVIVRTYVLEANRAAIDTAVRNAKPFPNAAPYQKCMVVLSDSKTVTVFLPTHLIIPVFVFNPEPEYGILYHGVRWIGWIAFAVHVLTIGNATLAVQIYVVGLIVVPTVLMHWKFGCDDSQWMKKWRKFWGKEVVNPYECWIGSRLKATCFEWPLDVEFTTEKANGRDPASYPAPGSLPADPKWYRIPKHTPLTTGARSVKRQDLYAWLNLSADEERSMGKWDLFPHQREGTKGWWADYNQKKALIALDPPKIDDMKRHRHVTMVIKRRRTTREVEISLSSQSRDSEEEIGTPEHEPKLGEPRVTLNTVSGPDGLIRSQSGKV